MVRLPLLLEMKIEPYAISYGAPSVPPKTHYSSRFIGVFRH